MSDTPEANPIHCQQCAAPLSVEQGSQFVTCQYCSTTNFVDKSRAVFHYAVRETVNQEEAVSSLRRWMAGNDTVKHLDQKSQIETSEFHYFPMWQVKVKQGDAEKLFLEPAAALSVSEYKNLTIPASDLEPYDHALDETAIAPTVPYETMRQWLVDDKDIDSAAIREVSLVHLPAYLCKYTFDGRRYTAVVDAATSKVFANIYPAKWEVPYLGIGILAFSIYFCLAFAPLGGYLMGDGIGVGWGAGEQRSKIVKVSRSPIRPFAHSHIRTLS